MTTATLAARCPHCQRDLKPAEHRLAVRIGFCSRCRPRPEPVRRTS